MSELAFEDLSSQRRLSKGPLLLKAAVGLGLTASVATFTDGLLGKKIWPSAPTRLVGLGPNTEEAALTFGGLGSTNTAKQSEFARQVLPGEPVYWDYSTDRVSMKEMSELFRGAAQSLRRVHINGHSMGGPLGLEVVRRSGVPELKLGHVILHCSPYKASDARLNTLGQGLKVLRFPAGPANKHVVSFIRYAMEGNCSLQESYARAKKEAVTGCSPRQWRSMELLRQGLNLGKHLEEFAPLIDTETRFSYCMPANSAADTTVRVEKACTNWQNDFVAPLRNMSGFDIPFDVYHVPGTGHAEVQKDCEYMAMQAAAKN